MFCVLRIVKNRRKALCGAAFRDFPYYAQNTYFANSCAGDGIGVERMFDFGGGEYSDNRKQKSVHGKERVVMKRKTLTPTFRKQLKEVYGTKCKICGEDGAEYHHLIPLWMGGDDRIENFVPLCAWHHMLLHKARTMRSNSKCHHGRNRCVAKVDGYKYILEDYLHCRIGTAECKQALGMSSKTAISDRKWFREYIKSQGIKAYKNNVDVLRKQEKRAGHEVLIHKEIVGWVEYEDGRREEYYSNGLKKPIGA